MAAHAKREVTDEEVLARMPPGREFTRCALGKPPWTVLRRLEERGLIRVLQVPPTRRNPRGVTVYKRVSP